jgi:hypothetical protein
MKKFLVLMLVLVMASMANAYVMSVVTDGVGSQGHAGTAEDPLVPSETILLKIVLENNPFSSGGTPFPDYDGYYLSSMDLDLHITGPGYAAPVITVLPFPPYEQEDLKNHAGLSPFNYTKDDGATGGFTQITGVALTPIGPGVQDIVWNIEFHCTGKGEVLIDLTLNGLSQYAEYEKTTSGGNWVWVDMTADDLGGLTIHQVPEPMTIALLGLGGLFLRRRK